MKYLYRCKDCSEELEVEQSIKDEPLTTCPKCGSKNFHRVIQKVLGWGFRKGEGHK